MCAMSSHLFTENRLDAALHLVRAVIAVDCGVWTHSRTIADNGSASHEVLGWHVTNAHDDIALLQIVGSTRPGTVCGFSAWRLASPCMNGCLAWRSKRSALASWVAGPWGDCLAACGGGPVQDYCHVVGVVISVRHSKCLSLAALSGPQIKVSLFDNR